MGPAHRSPQIISPLRGNLQLHLLLLWNLRAFGVGKYHWCGETKIYYCFALFAAGDAWHGAGKYCRCVIAMFCLKVFRPVHWSCN